MVSDAPYDGVAFSLCVPRHGTNHTVGLTSSAKIVANGGLFGPSSSSWARTKELCAKGKREGARVLI